MESPEAKCPGCGFTPPAGGRFCLECGTRLLGPPCGHPNPQGARFCSECGQRLLDSGAPPAIDYARPQSYTPRFLAEKILTQRSSLQGERKLLTVMFTDVANFTPLSERVGPEVVHQIMDGCFRILLDETHRYEGTINQFTGDGVMALFGAPLAHEDHAVRACHAALAIQEALKPFGEDLRKSYGVEFNMRVGLNSGPVIVGAIGDDLRMDYTAVGDTTNLAARMEQMAEPGQILLSATTRRLAKDFFVFRELGKKKVKGKQEEQEIFELVRVGDFSSRLEAAAARGLTPFVGREEAIEHLLEGFEKARTGAGRVIGIVGEAGAGKSRLLLEFRGRLPMGEVCYLEGRCIRFGHAMAYLPIREIIRSYFGIAEGEPDAVRTGKMAAGLSSVEEGRRPALVPLQELLGIRVEDPSWLALEPREKRERVFKAARDLLQGESRSRPVVIAVEDLHWVDKSSEEFLDYLIGYLEGVRILLLTLYRPEYQNPWGENPFFRRVSADQLPSQSGAALVGALLKGGEVAPDLADLIYTRSGGNPLFMEELTRTLLENGAIRCVGRCHSLADSSCTREVPDTVQGIIAARMDRLSERLKATLQAASVIGREFGVDLLGSVSERGQELNASLSELQGLEFVYMKGGSPEAAYFFKHALTQEVAYNSLLVAKRREIHQRIGDAIERIYPERLEGFYEVLADHFSKGETPEKAIRYLRLSAEKALSGNSLWVALRLYKELLRLLDGMEEITNRKVEKIATLVSMIPILRELGFPEDPADILQEGARLCEEANDQRSMAIIRGFASMSFAYRGDAVLGSQFLEESCRRAEERGDFETLGSLVQGLIPNYFLAGKFGKIVDMTSRVAACFIKAHPGSEPFGMPFTLRLHLQVNRAVALGFVGEFEAGERECRKALATAAKADHPLSVGIAELACGILLTTRGMEEQAIPHLEESIDRYEKAQGTMWLPIAWSHLGLCCGRLGRNARALECLEKALEMQAGSEVQALLAMHHCHLGCVYLEQGAHEKGLHHAGEAARMAATHDEEHYHALSLVFLGVSEWNTGRPLPSAEGRVRDGVSRLEELELRPWAAQGRLLLGGMLGSAGERGRAEEELRLAEGMFREMGMESWLRRAQEKRSAAKNTSPRKG